MEKTLDAYLKELVDIAHSTRLFTRDEVKAFFRNAKYKEK